MVRLGWQAGADRAAGGSARVGFEIHDDGTATIPLRAWFWGIGLSLVLWALIAALAVLLFACAQPGPAPLSRTAWANPNCLYRCQVSVSSIDQNDTDSLAPTLTGGARTETTTETTTR